MTSIAPAGGKKTNQLYCKNHQFMRIENKNHNKDLDHAKAMFRENSEYFATLKNEFDILPYSEKYCYKNRDCFIHKDKGEPFIFIKELTDIGYLKQTGSDYNLVTITEEGHSFLSIFNRTY